MKGCGPERFEQVILITTMKAKDGDRQKKVPVLLKLYSLLQQCSSSSKLSIHVDDRLHGNVYIGQRGDRFVDAIISSANFAGNGIERNHEWGVFQDEYRFERTGFSFSSTYAKLYGTIDDPVPDTMKFDEGGKNLVIFGAPFPGNSGGFAARRDELISNRDSIGIVFELFLWPDNKSDGDVECLMEQIARRDFYY